MDVKRNGITDKTSNPKRFSFKRPHDNKTRHLIIYESVESTFTSTLRLMIAPVLPVTYGLIGKIPPLAPTRPTTLAKRIHNATHAPAEQILRIFKYVRWSNGGVKKSIRQNCGQCKVSAQSGSPTHSIKISLSHVNQAFNDDFQADFTYVKILDKNYTLVHYVDPSTVYSEGATVHDRKRITIVQEFYKLWINRHSTPNYFPADDEFNRINITNSISEMGIQFKPRPARRHNNIFVVGRKNGTLKRIFERLQLDKKLNEAADSIIPKAFFLPNKFPGSSMLSSF